jgi:hypothetical protein
MLWIIWTAVALAGGILVEAQVPVEVLVEDRPYVKMFYPGQARFDWELGTVEVTLMIQGKPRKISVEVPETGYIRVIAGRHGVSHDTPPEQTAAATESQVIFRAVGREPVQLRLGAQRHVVAPQQEFTTTLTTGKHAVEVRNLDGTLIWARGHLNLSGQEDVIVQMLEGRLPEVIGLGSQFLSSGR